MNPIILDKVRGCMLGGAVGDALGYPVRKLSYIEICDRYGAEGIKEYELTDGKAVISDNTQLALFTANGLLIGKTRQSMRGVGGPDAESVRQAYSDWIKTQKSNNTNESHVTWLYNIEKMHNERLTTESVKNALEHEDDSKNRPTSEMKDFGGIVRIAPVGLYFKEEDMSLEDIDKIAADITAITHDYDSAYIAAAAMTHIVNRLTYTEMSVKEAVNDSINTIKKLYGYKPRIDRVVDAMLHAMELAESDMHSQEAISELGTGIKSYEALAIAIYCSVKYNEDFEKAVQTAVNHDGESAATGLLTGNILGAYLGARAIPESFLENLELRHVIQIVAEDLYEDCPNTDYFSNFNWIWEEKYGEACYII